MKTAAIWCRAEITDPQGRMVRCMLTGGHAGPCLAGGPICDGCGRSTHQDDAWEMADGSECCGSCAAPGQLWEDRNE